MNDQWMFDARVLPVDVVTTDRRKINGQVRVALPLPIMVWVEDEHAKGWVMAGVGLEVRRHMGNPWISVSGTIERPELFPNRIDGATFTVGAEMVNPTYIHDDDGVIVLVNPSLVRVVVHTGTEPAMTPVWEGTELRLMAPFDLLHP